MASVNVRRILFEIFEIFSTVHTKSKPEKELSYVGLLLLDPKYYLVITKLVGTTKWWFVSQESNVMTTSANITIR